MSVLLSEGECTTAWMLHSVVTDVMREQWDKMEAGERAFFIYCLLRLRHQLEVSTPEPQLPQPEPV